LLQTGVSAAIELAEFRQQGEQGPDGYLANRRRRATAAAESFA
jgi:hypothetical protein